MTEAARSVAHFIATDDMCRRPPRYQPTRKQMSIKLYEGDFDDLTGAIFASWFTFNPIGPTACAVGFAETADMPWSIFFRRMHPTGAKTYLGAAIDEEISAAPNNFGDVFLILCSRWTITSHDQPR